MSTKTHQKHAKLNRPNYGEFHRQEWAFIGAPCGDIQALVQYLIGELGNQYRLAYVDADHTYGDQAKEIIPANSHISYTDKINFHRFDRLGELGQFQQRMTFLDADAVLVNGNHFRAKKQVVFLDPRKRESLSRKLDRLTDVALVITSDEQTEPYVFLNDHISLNNIPHIHIKDKLKLKEWFGDQLSNSIAPLNGLVLAGGKSQRMGENKALLNYYGQAQYLRTAGLLAATTEQVFLSLREGQQLDTDLPIIKDSFAGLGPFGAICSAFRKEPNRAWLVLACDLPLLDESGIQQLVEARDPSRLATAFYNKATGWPDPLVTIWEPRAYPVLLQFLAQGYSCPRKVLINTDIKEIKPKNELILRNANKPEERDEIMAILGQ